MHDDFTYRNSANSFQGNYTFLNLTFVHTGAETIQERKLFKGGNYMRKYGISPFFSYLMTENLDNLRQRLLTQSVTCTSLMPEIHKLSLVATEAHYSLSLRELR